MRILAPLILGATVFGLAVPSHPATRPPGSLEIGFLLIAIDVRSDHLRISEGLRVSNSGPPAVRDITFTVPPGAAYVTFHRGVPSPRRRAGGLTAQMRFPTGVTEIAYSYALPVGRDVLLSRTFPLPARRVEIVVRGIGARFAVRDGVALPPTDVGGQRLDRWEVRNLPAASPLVISLRGLPVRRRWIPAAAAVGLAAVLAAALLLSLRRRE